MITLMINPTKRRITDPSVNSVCHTGSAAIACADATS
jgi:hypothetical protein